jgi:septal ring factor EnvC (AmiA/AmiB activator)
MTSTAQTPAKITADMNLSTITIILALIGTVFSAGFGLGIKYEESNSKISKAEMQSTLAQTQVKLASSENNVEQLKIANSQLKISEQKLQEDIIQKGLSIANLNTQANRTNNCEFLHAQIKAAQIELRANGIGVWEAGPTLKNKISDENVALGRRIAAYTQQLSSCSK